MGYHPQKLQKVLKHVLKTKNIPCGIYFLFTFFFCEGVLIC